MAACVIFGGAGYIGTHLAQHLVSSGRFDRVHLADIRPATRTTDKVSASITDVRKPIPAALIAERPVWIFNLAAVHREPGHEAHEYFDTNLPGARNVCAYAAEVGCQNIFFTSSISVYGPTTGPPAEDSRICPITPHGGSKYPAELIHEAWLAGHNGRRLIICRPGVVYGPGDPGNILRMIKAIKRGYFAYPGSPGIHKSYAYIFGLLESIDFIMRRDERQVVYNYVESPTEPLGELVRITKEFLGSKAPVFRIPGQLLVPAASLAQLVMGTHNPIHPVRVKKAAMSTHIVPGVLQKLGFEFKYPYRKSLEHWRSIIPRDFEA
ncbi:MAG: NAD(P)-dependent oxidoreductase [Proteobacteria bacterium]|nr:NAD(P)-dependent oxidoreductase [Pseudomonadota bacterium]